MTTVKYKISEGSIPSLSGVHFGAFWYTRLGKKKMPKTLVLSILVHFGTLGMRRGRVLNLTLQYAQYQLFTRTLFAKSTR